jgi:hypothetical protein
MKSSAGSTHLRVSTAESWLLIASTQSGATAQAAWDQWRAQCQIEAADSNSQAMFSMLYANLGARLGGPEANLLKGIYRRTWYANQLAFAQLRPLLDRFAEHDIPTVLMSDAALVAGHYPDIAYRAIRCIDLLVRAEHWDQSIALPTENGWQALRSKLPASPNSLSVTSFSGPAGHTVRIWTNLFTAEPQRDTEARIWDAAQVIEIACQPVSVLGPVEQLLCLSADSFREKDASLIRYADAIRLLESLRSTSDWTRLVWQAQRYEHILPLRIMLTFLTATLAVSLPSWVLPALRKMAISHGELLQYHRACDSLPLRVKAACLRWISPFRPGAARDG